MKIKYLSYSQANAICADYQYLIGKPFEANGTDGFIVKQIIIAPYSRILQWQYIRSIFAGVPEEEALRICPNGRFDVLVLPDQDFKPAKQAIITKDLRTYLAENGIAFNYETYHALKTA